MTQIGTHFTAISSYSMDEQVRIRMGGELSCADDSVRRVVFDQGVLKTSIAGVAFLRWETSTS